MYDARTRAYLSRCLADAFLAGVWNERALVDRAGRALERRPRWVRSVAREVLAGYHRPPSDRPRELARFIEVMLRNRRPGGDDPGPPRVRRWLVPEPAMGRRRWPVPEIASVGALATFLGVSDGELAWFADARALERRVEDERLRHYRYGFLRRPGRPARVIERPKRRLKDIQRRILHEILDLIPAHEATHGFTRGRSVRSHASEHTGQFVVIRLDLEDFFASIAASRVYGTFRTAGYPESVAHSLTALTTNVVPSGLWMSLPRPADSRQIDAHHRLGRRLATPHLPQGAPTSPALANLAAFRLDRRLSGLVASLEVSYTRYADDLTFSGPARLVRAANTLRRAVAEIAREENFAVNDQKSMLATRAGRQRVCGVVVNERLNVPRYEYDILKAILHNSRVHGPASQNREAVPDFRAHLLGRLSWIESLNPKRGKKLRRQFASIAWTDDQ
ncbi:MAG: reverse transcriptase family protein [Actinomycetota bacterium]|nr:reverse transcriptase family protein [Actinomycetota bacterium]